MSYGYFDPTPQFVSDVARDDGSIVNSATLNDMLALIEHLADDTWTAAPHYRLEEGRRMAIQLREKLRT